LEGFQFLNAKYVHLKVHNTTKLLPMTVMPIDVYIHVQGGAYVSVLQTEIIRLRVFGWKCQKVLKISFERLLLPT